MNDWINLRAVRWARKYETHSPAERAVLFEFALHADERGYTWPSAVGIATEWHHDDETISEAIEALLVRRAFSRTKKRRGKTGRLKVYRLPKITWEIPRQSANSTSSKITDKSPGNYREIPRQSATNKEHGTKNNSEKRAEGNSAPSCDDRPMAGLVKSVLDSLSSSKEESPERGWFYEIRQAYPGTTIDEDLKSIAEWARKKNKKLTRELVLNALKRNPPKKPGQRDGFVYQTKFIGYKDALALAVKDTEFQLNAKRAIRYTDGQIEIISNAA